MMMMRNVVFLYLNNTLKETSLNQIQGLNMAKMIKKKYFRIHFYTKTVAKANQHLSSLLNSSLLNQNLHLVPIINISLIRFLIINTLINSSSSNRNSVKEELCCSAAVTRQRRLSDLTWRSIYSFTTHFPLKPDKLL